MRAKPDSGRFTSPVDAGLQPERTFLAWTRTAGSLAVLGLLGLRWAAQWGLLAVLITLGPAVLLSALLGLTRLREGRLAGALGKPGSMPAGWRPVRVRRRETAVLVTATGVAAIGALAVVAIVLR